MNKKELQARLIENNVKDIMQSDYALEVMNRDDDNHFIVVREYDFDAYSIESPLNYFDEWTVVTENGYKELVDLLGDYVYDIYDKHDNTQAFFEHVSKYARRQGLLLVPVSEYEHGSVTFSRGVRQGWDVGVCGFAYLDIKDVTNGCGFKRFSSKHRESELKSLDTALEMFTQYCNGDVYAVTSYDTLTGDYIESVGDIYDEDELKEYTEQFSKQAIEQA